MKHFPPMSPLLPTPTHPPSAHGSVIQTVLSGVTSDLAENPWVIVMIPPTLSLTIHSTCSVPGPVDPGDTRMNKVRPGPEGAPHLGRRTDRTNATSWRWPRKGRKVQCMTGRKTKSVRHQAHIPGVQEKHRKSSLLAPGCIIYRVSHSVLNLS